MRHRMRVEALVVDPVSTLPIVVLRSASDPRLLLPIRVGRFEADAISLELEGIESPRPMTHDLLREVVAALGARVVEAAITEVRDNTFHAEILLADPAGSERRIDCRPSDAIALALRAGAPIRVAESVVRDAEALEADADCDESVGSRRWFEALDAEQVGPWVM